MSYYCTVLHCVVLNYRRSQCTTVVHYTVCVLVLYMESGMNCLYAMTFVPAVHCYTREKLLHVF